MRAQGLLCQGCGLRGRKRSLYFFILNSMKNQDVPHTMHRYLDYGLAIRNYSPKTILAYRSTFNLFLKYTKAEELTECTENALEAYFYHGRIDRKWCAVTFRQHYKHLNCFFKWCIKRELMEHNPLTTLEKPRVEQRLPKKLTRDEAQVVLDASFHMKYAYRYERYRNQALVALMLFAGLRRSETINLKVQDICLKEKTIFIRQGKGKKDREIPMNRRLKTILQSYLKERERLSRESLQFITGINEKKPFGETGIKRIFERLRATTGIQFTPHTLRHSFATLMLEGGCDIYTLSKIMGHSKITTTTIYLMCSNPQMAKSIEKHVLI